MTALSLFAVAAHCVGIPAESDTITAADLAPAAPVFAAAPEDSRIGFAPAPGVRRTFTEAELRRVAQRLGLTGEIRSVCVERPEAPLSTERILAAMRHAIPGAAIDLVDWSRHPAPVGVLEFPASGLQASGLWRGFMRYGGTRRFAVWARVKVRVKRAEAVALEPLAAGKPIGPTQVRLEEVEGLPTRDPHPASLDEVVGRLPRRSIPKGAAITKGMLAEAPEVSRGETVRVEVRWGGARLELEARAERDGRRGERILLFNPDTKRRFPATVAGKGRASVGDGEKR
jgi:flagella basal body P-ring formation protein FlgA